MIKPKNILLLLGFCLAVILLFVSYSNIFKLFYQQDEWLALGIFLGGGIKSYLENYSIWQTLGGTSRALSLLFQYPMYILFPFQIWPFAVFSLFFHFLNSLLVYWFAYRLTKKYLLAFLASVIFLCNSVPAQAVLWFAANTTTLPSATFLLFSLIFAILGAQKRKPSLFLLSQLSAIISFLFKESGVIAFVVAPYLYYVWGKRYSNRKDAIVQLMPLTIYGLFIVGVNIYRILSAPRVLNSPLTEHSALVWEKIVLHALLYPIISLSQIYIPQQILITMAKLFQQINYGSLQGFTASQRGVESIVSDYVSFGISIVILALAWLVARRVKEYRYLILFSVCFIGISFLPYVLIEKGTTYLDSRYFYVGSIGAGLLMSSILFAIARRVQVSSSKFMGIYMVSIFLFVGFFVWKHVQYIQRTINFSVIEASERMHFLNQLKRLFPKLPNNSVLYVTGNNNGYYGISELKIPFQQGPGYTFMVWYYPEGTIPPDLLKNYYLWRIRDQGYQSVGEKSFGYFYNFDALATLVKSGTISHSHVIGLYYDTDTKTLRDITIEVTQRLIAALN